MFSIKFLSYTKKRIGSIKFVTRMIEFLPGGSKLVESTGLLFVSNIFERGIAIAISVLITRSLGIENYGIYTAAMVAGALSQRLAEAGIPMLLQREISARPEDEERIFNIAFTLRVLTTSLMLIGLFIYGVIWARSSTEIAAIALSAVINGFQGLVTIVFSAFYAHLQMKYEAITRVVSRIVYLVGVYFLYQWKANLVGFMSYYAFAILLQTVIAFLLFKQKYFAPGLRFNWLESIEFMKPALVMGLSRIVTLTYDRLDTLIISLFLPVSAVGYYGISYSIFTSSFLFSNAYYNSTYSVLSRNNISNLESFWKDFLRLSSFALLLGIVIGLAMFLMGELAVVLLYGQEFLFAGFIVRILSVGIPFIFLHNLCQGALNARNLQAINLLVTISALLVNAIGNIILLPKLGVIGAAIVTVVTEAYILVISFGTIFWIAKTGRIPKVSWQFS